MSAPPIVHWVVSREDYPELRRICPDIVVEYDELMARIDEFLGGVHDKGGVAAKVIIKPLEFEAWCKATGRPCDNKARSNFAVMKFTEKQK